jgi:undecaprenyl diphosphate synthase
MDIIVYIISLYLLLLHYTEDKFIISFKELLIKNNIYSTDFYEILFYTYIVSDRSEIVILNVFLFLKKIDMLLTKRIYKDTVLNNNEKISDLLKLLYNHDLLKILIINYINNINKKLFCNDFINIISESTLYIDIYFILKEILEKKKLNTKWNIPKKDIHIGIILDGNRRFAKKNNVKNGHLFGSLNAIRIIYFLYNHVKECTLYILSYDNFIKRKNEEKENIFNIIYSYLLELINYIIRTNDVYIRFIGELNLLPDNIRDKINEINNICINKKIEECFLVNYAIIYDGRREIYYCMKKYFSKNNNDTKYENMNNIMWLKNDIHLVIRTGGTHRMSSFFPWQSIYAEWYFLDKYWPEITEEDIYNIMNDYSSKIINYGS